MPQQVGRPKKEGNRKTSGNPRGRPRLIADKLTDEEIADIRSRDFPPLTTFNKIPNTKGADMSEAHAKFGMDEPCRVILHWRDGYGVGTDEILCKSYSLTHGVVFLATKVGEQIVPLLNVRKFEVVRI